MKTKVCKSCKIEKELVDYFTSSQTKDGYRNNCKACYNKRSKEWRAKNPERVKELRKNWEIANPGRTREFIKNWKTANPERRREFQREWAMANSLKIKAHSALYRAVKTFKLIRPASCSQCPSTLDIEAHHHDYTKPLDVVWLCRSCHRKIHRKYA